MLHCHSRHEYFKEIASFRILCLAVNLIEALKIRSQKYALRYTTQHGVSVPA